MNKEDILNLSKQENKRFDERQKEGIVDSCNKAYRIGRLLCAIILSLEAFVLNKINYGMFTIFMIMTGTYLFYEYKYTQRKYRMILSVIYLLAGIVFFIIFIVKLF